MILLRQPRFELLSTLFLFTPGENPQSQDQQDQRSKNREAHRPHEKNRSHRVHGHFVTLLNGTPRMGEVAFKQIRHLGGGLDPLGRIFLHQTIDERFQPGRNVGIERSNGGWLLLADLAKNGERIRCAEGLDSGTHRIEHAAQAEQVGPVIDGFSAGLLRRHVLRRAGHHAVLGQPQVVGHARQAEIGYLDHAALLTPRPGYTQAANWPA